MAELKAPEPGMKRPIPSKRLNRDIRETVFQYDWDNGGPGSYIDSGNGNIDDPLLRAVLLCRARSADWSGVLKKAIASSDWKRYHQRLSRHLCSDTPSAQRDRDELYREMTSRLIDPGTLQPVDITSMGSITLAREVADGNIQIEYAVSNDAASRERI